ncbi:hypothetical protein L3Q82_006314 [Scortum barcoo]|uniref:Uncharacterized protein n=1 Tax=Scortum barcoo TaxID=214431 RepID=A0ACB8X3N8_9TELE|nr:hypothetical protein L3Q82_006314 [Scortum barcoo]
MVRQQQPLSEHGQDQGDGPGHEEREEAAPASVMIRDCEVECVSSFKFLGNHICDDLTWTLKITQLVKKAHQQLYILEKDFDMIYERIHCTVKPVFICADDNKPIES